VFGVPVQLSNFEPPGVSFVVAEAESFVFEDGEADSDAELLAEWFDCELVEVCSPLLPLALTLPLAVTVPLALALALALPLALADPLPLTEPLRLPLADPLTLPLPLADTVADVDAPVEADVDAKVDEDSSAFFAWPWSSAETDAEVVVSVDTEVVTLAEDCSCAA